MKTVLIAASVLVVGCGAALAQNASTSSGNSAQSSSQQTGMQGSPGTSGMNSMPIRQQLQDNLQKAGFSDISIVPASFLVHAKDKSGRPTAMVVTPDSLTMVTDVSNGGNDSNGSPAQNSASKQ